MRPLGGDTVADDRDRDPRQVLVDWMVDAKNPFFAKAVARGGDGGCHRGSPFRQEKGGGSRAGMY